MSRSPRVVCVGMVSLLMFCFASQGCAQDRFKEPGILPNGSLGFSEVETEYIGLGIQWGHSGIARSAWNAIEGSTTGTWSIKHSLESGTVLNRTLRPGTLLTGFKCEDPLADFGNGSYHFCCKMSPGTSGIYQAFSEQDGMGEWATHECSPSLTASSDLHFNSVGEQFYSKLTVGDAIEEDSVQRGFSFAELPFSNKSIPSSLDETGVLQLGTGKEQATPILYSNAGWGYSLPYNSSGCLLYTSPSPRD